MSNHSLYQDVTTGIGAQLRVGVVEIVMLPGL